MICAEAVGVACRATTGWLDVLGIGKTDGGRGSGVIAEEIVVRTTFDPMGSFIHRCPFGQRPKRPQLHLVEGHFRTTGRLHMLQFELVMRPSGIWPAGPKESAS